MWEFQTFLKKYTTCYNCEHLAKELGRCYSFYVQTSLDKLSARLDGEVGINLKISINFSLYVIVLLLSSFFLIGTEK